jgi:hypothetical protein
MTVNKAKIVDMQEFILTGIPLTASFGEEEIIL